VGYINGYCSLYYKHALKTELFRRSYDNTH